MDRTEGTLGNKGIPHNSGSERIRDDIRGTRRTMDTTLDELGARLRPAHLLEDLFTAFLGSRGPTGTHEAREQIVNTTRKLGAIAAQCVRDNPGPSLLVGAGLVWWLMESSGQSVSTSDISAGARESAEGIKDRVSDVASSAGEKISQSTSAARDKLSEVGRSAMERGGELSQTAAEYARRGADATKETFTRSSRQIGEAANRYPLAMGGACLAAGLLAGVLLPRTEREDELLGRAADRLREGATATGQEILERGKDVAARTAESALKAAESHGLTPESIVEKAKSVVTEAASAATRAASEQGVSPEQLKATAQDVAQSAGETAQSEGRRAAESTRVITPSP